MRYQALLMSLLTASALAARTPAQPRHDKRQNAAAILQGVGVFIKSSGTTTAEAPDLTALSVSSGSDEDPLADEENQQQGEGQPEEQPVEDEQEEAPAEGEQENNNNEGQNVAENENENQGGGGGGDALVFNFAFTLERLETTFYQQAAAALNVRQWEKLGISGNAAQLIADTLSAIAQDEATHTSTIASTLAAVGAQANTECSFEFGQALNDPFTFLSVARALEYTGASAYHGAVPIIQDKSLLSAGASIATVEARHSSLLNLFVGGDPIPQAFDMALTPPEVLALVGGFLQDCTPEDLGLTSTPPLLIAAANDGSSIINIGTTLVFASLANIDEENHFCQLLIGGQSQAVVQPVSNCVVSPNIATSGLKLDGPVFAWITSDATPIAADVNVRSLTNLVAGPALFFLDGQKRQEVFSAPLNIQALGSANLGFNQFGDFVALGNGGRNQVSFQYNGPLAQESIDYAPQGGKRSRYSLKKKASERSGKRSATRPGHVYKRRLSKLH